ncbi:phosphotriesterase [Chloroflexota bacterium]
MMQEELTGKVQTVLGIINADSLGVTLPHEHLLADLTMYFVEPTEASEKGLAHEPITLENLHWVHLHLENNADNLKLADEKVAIKEALLHRWAGGDTIVELSNIGLSRDPLGLARIARATGLNVVMGSGYYIGLSHPPELAAKTEGEITEEIVRDITVGVGETGVRAGIIGEIGCSTPLEDNERKVLRASAAAQQRTGAAINIHQNIFQCAQNTDKTETESIVLGIIKVLGDAGADLSRTVISHCDHSNFSRTTYHRLADAGCYIEFETFGRPAIPFFSVIGGEGFLDMPSDVWRINEIKSLISEGYLNHILISHDVCFKSGYVTYGGCGYAHILRNVVPWMRQMGISDEQIHTLMVENPKRILSFAPVKE